MDYMRRVEINCWRNKTGMMKLWDKELFEKCGRKLKILLTVNIIYKIKEGIGSEQHLEESTRRKEFLFEWVWQEWGSKILKEMKGWIKSQKCRLCAWKKENFNYVSLWKDDGEKRKIDMRKRREQVWVQYLKGEMYEGMCPWWSDRYVLFINNVKIKFLYIGQNLKIKVNK